MAQARSTEKSPEDKAGRLFQSNILTAIFGRSRATLVTHSIFIVVIVGGLALITVGLLSPRTSLNWSATRGPLANVPIGLQVGDRAPDFTLTNLSGDDVSLSDYRGKPVMLNFWYPSCSDCVNEIPTIQQYYTSKQSINNHFSILAVNFVDDEQTVQDFVRQKHLTYPIVMDDQQLVSTLYHVRETPTSYFIDPQGIIQSVLIGPVNNSFLKRVLTDPSRAN